MNIELFKTTEEPKEESCESSEELYFLWYLRELKNLGYIKGFRRAETYTLSEVVSKKYIKPMKKIEDKYLNQTLVRSHVFTPDYVIWWEKESVGVLATDLEDIFDYHKTAFICQREHREFFSIVEIKGGYDKNNMERLAKVNIKWLHSKRGIFVNLCKVPKVFEKTFTPTRYLLTNKTMKERNLKYNPRSLEDFIDQL